MVLTLKILLEFFYTHFHFDHIGDLATIIPWLHVRAWATAHGSVNDTPSQFTIYGPQGIKAYIQSLYQHTFLPPLPNFVQVVELALDRSVNIDNFCVLAHKIPHTKESVGYRFTFANGKTLAVSGDTAHDDAVIDLIKNADVAVLECSYDDALFEKTKDEVRHLSPTTAASLAQRAKAKTLILTHIYPYADAINIEQIARQFFSGTVIVAYDGLKIEFD